MWRPSPWLPNGPAPRELAAGVAGVSARLGRRAGPRAARHERTPERSPRSSLITQLLTLQLAIVTAVGLLALGGLYWTSRTVIDENLTHWATQWARELNELGAPFYLSNTGEAVVDVERFTEKYPEIDARELVRARRAADVLAESATQKRAAARRRAPSRGSQRSSARASPYLLTANRRARRCSSASPGRSGASRRWATACSNVGSDAQVDTERKLLGFVAVDLDYSWYHKQFLPKLWVASLALLALLGASWIIGRVLIKRALSPARGAAGAAREPRQRRHGGGASRASEHSEIHRIVSALEETTVALHERDRRLVHLAMHDSLTGLYNRHRFVDGARAGDRRDRATTATAAPSSSSTSISSSTSTTLAAIRPVTSC